MDDADGLPLSSPLPLSQPAVQALIDNQDALLSSQSTGDVEMEESHTVLETSGFAPALRGVYTASGFCPLPRCLPLQGQGPRSA